MSVIGSQSRWPRSGSGFAVCQLAARSIRATVGLAVAVTAGRCDPWYPERPYCPEDGDYPEQVAVLLDASDTLNDSQIDDAADRVWEELQTHAMASSIELFGLDEGAPFYRVCKPLNPDEIGERVLNEEMVRDEWESERRRIRRQVREGLMRDQKDASHILRSVQRVAISAFDRADAHRPRTLIIVSDLAENSDVARAYSPVSPWPFEYQHVKSTRAMERVRVNLEQRGVDRILLLWLNRGYDVKVVADDLESFWRDYLEDMGIDIDSDEVKFRRVDG